MPKLQPPTHLPHREADVSPDEWALRVNLAASCRLIAHYEWDELVQNHASARLQEDRGFLINPFGVHYFEINASSLVRITAEGRPAADSPYDVNPAALATHREIYRARRDVGCILHTHTIPGIAVATQPEGLLPLTQTALFFFRDNLRYHSYDGVAVTEPEGRSIANDLGQAQALLLRNHGLIVAEPTIPHAFTTLFYLERACALQLALQSSGTKVVPLEPTLQRLVRNQLEAYPAEYRLSGVMEWPGLLRLLDRKDSSFRH